MYSIMASTNSDSLTFSFPIWIPFISFSSLIAVLRIYKTVLNKSSESGHPCLVPDLGGKAFSFSLFSMLAIGLSYMDFIMLKYVPSVPLPGEFLLWIHVEFCQKIFLHLLRWSYGFYYSVCWCDDSHWSVDNEKSLHPWDNPTSSWCMILLMYC